MCPKNREGTETTQINRLVPMGMDLPTIIKVFGTKHSVVWVPLDEYQKVLFEVGPIIVT